MPFVVLKYDVRLGERHPAIPTTLRIDTISGSLRRLGGGINTRLVGGTAGIGMAAVGLVAAIRFRRSKHLVGIVFPR